MKKVALHHQHRPGQTDRKLEREIETETQLLLTRSTFDVRQIENSNARLKLINHLEAQSQAAESDRSKTRTRD